MHPFVYLFAGLDGQGRLAPWMWISVILSLVAIVLLLFPAVRQKESVLKAICVIVLLALWIDKGLCLVIAGFIPNPFEQVTQYEPTIPEIAVTLGIYSVGAFILTVLYKIAVSVKEEAKS